MGELTESVIAEAANICASKGRADFFNLLTTKIGSLCQADYAFVCELTSEKLKATTVSLCAHGKIVDNFSYDLAGTPCHDLTLENACSYPSAVAQQFPEDQLLIDMGIEAYVGVALRDMNNQPIGLLVALFEHSISKSDCDKFIKLFQIFELRAAVELEQYRYQEKLSELMIGSSSFDDGDTQEGDCVKNEHASGDTDDRHNYRFIKYQATHDALTGLLNRSEFFQYVDRVAQGRCSSGTVRTLMILDLDDFKEVNEMIGHAEGDRLLKNIAVKLVEKQPDTAVTARLDGDEFGVFVEVGSIEEVNALCKDMLDIFFKPFALNESASHYLSASIGASLCPVTGAPAKTLFMQAEQSLRKAKQSGKHNFEIFDQKLEAELIRQQSIKLRLKNAIVNRDIVPHFQPIIDASTGRTVYVEALARWGDEELGSVFPDEFIPTAERYGLMTELGACVAQQAVECISNFNKTAGIDIGLAVNMSPSEFHQQSIDALLDCVHQNGFPPSLLCVEVTENLMIDDPKLARAKLLRLKEFGAHISMDDFGTGYSSLAYLNNLPFDVLKIDRSFVNDLGKSDNALLLVKTILELAKNLNLRCVAEGVETEEQVGILVELGCRFMQGYYFSKPLTYEALERLVNTGQMTSVSGLRQASRG